MTGQRLPRAFRSRPRPSSALGAKASIVCPCSLDRKNIGDLDVAMEFSRCTRASARPAFESPVSRSLKTQQRTSKSHVEVDVLLGESDGPTAEAIKGSDAYRNEFPDSLERR